MNADLSEPSCTWTLTDMPSPRRYFWGIGFKIVMFFGIPAGVTLLLLWGLFVPLAQDIMFDHEMTDLADETELRGYELADQTQSLIGEFLSLARLIEERNTAEWIERCRSAERQYLLIEVIDTTEMEGEFAPLEVQTSNRFGTSIAPEENESYRQFLSELIERLRDDRSSERIHTKLSKARLKIRPNESTSRTEEAHVFWAGGQIIPATSDSNGKILLMGLGLDDRFARMGSTPRHMTVVVDHRGMLILNPFERKQVSDEAGSFNLSAAALEEPFANARWLETLSEYAVDQVDWELSQLTSILFPFLSEPWYSQQGLLLPAGVKYYYWESDDAGLEPGEIAIALATLRRMALNLADQEWRANSESEVAPLNRVGGLSTTVSTLRLLASSQAELESLRKKTIAELRAAFEQNLPAEKHSVVFEKLDRLAAERIVPVECTSGRVSTISVPLASGPNIEASGVMISRVVFSEEVKAALGERLSEATLYSSLMIALVFGLVLLSGLKIASLLRRMSRSAEAVSSLTFDQETDSDRWEQQVNELSSTLPTDRKDELGVLAQSFQKMIRDILSSQLALRDLNRDLEQ
ncbi:MAG TPA: HAMP domain-containing protein, partial [Planctomycetaceae bacterium]|nr:HAMP domain-containing protein [Planctomycetaceae bacterium]